MEQSAYADVDHRLGHVAVALILLHWTLILMKKSGLYNNLV